MSDLGVIRVSMRHTFLVLNAGIWFPQKDATRSLVSLSNEGILSREKGLSSLNSSETLVNLLNATCIEHLYTIRWLKSF